MHTRFLTVLPVVAFVLTLLLAAPAWAQADLDISKSDNPDPVDTGDLVRYTLRVTNEGTAPLTNANDVEVIDNLPLARMDFRSVRSEKFRCTFTGGPVRCELRDGEILEPDESGRIEIVVEAEDAGTVENTAIVRADGEHEDRARETTRIEAREGGGGTGTTTGTGTTGTTGTGTTGEATTTQDDTTGTTTGTGTSDPVADEVTTEDAGDSANREGSFRCDSFLHVVRDDDGALRRQYRDGIGDDELVVQRFEQCLEADVLANTVPDRILPNTGGPLLPIGGGVLLLVTGAGLALRMIRR